MNNFHVEKNQKRNPMAEYLLKLQLIITNTEFKDKDEADKYETLDMKLAGEKYWRAKTETDVFESYEYDTGTLTRVLRESGIPEDKIPYFLENRAFIPPAIQTILKLDAREQFLDAYYETNPYYVMLSGVPYPGSEFLPPEEILTIPDEFYNIYQTQNVIMKDQAVHEMPVKYQDLFMNTKYYTQMLAEHPKNKYLKYIGSKAIPIEVSRHAHDGDIMQINTGSLSTSHPVFGNVSVEPSLLHLFTNTYNNTHSYIYGALRGDFSDIYANYNSFIRFLTIYMTIGGCLNELMKQSSTMIYVNQSTANDFFMLYGLPSVIMEGQSMISFLKQFRMILMDKGTNIVYRVKDLIGYEYTDIYTLVMIKQQVFEKGQPKYTTDADGNRVPVQEIVFRRMGTTDENTSYFKFRDSRDTYTLEQITSGDPRWWNTPEVDQMLTDMNYTLSNSKYIQLSTHLSMTDIYWQCVILIRGLLDNRYETEYIKLATNLNAGNGNEISVFEAVLILEILMNWHIQTIRGDTLHGDMYVPNGMYNGEQACIDMLFNGLDDHGVPLPLKPGLPFKVSSFNFDFVSEFPRLKDYEDYINRFDYLEPDKFLPMLDTVFGRKLNNVGEVLMGDVKKIYNYLEKKLQQCTTIHQFRQVVEVFSRLFLVDPQRNWYDDGMIDVDAYLCDTYGISLYELTQLKTFKEFQTNYENHDPDMIVQYNDKQYPIYMYRIMNEDVMHMNIIPLAGTSADEETPFMDTRFVDAFMSEFDTYKSEALENSAMSINVRSRYKSIIEDKVVLDVGNGANGPRTLEALLFRNDPDMYRHLVSLRGNNENLILIMRSLVKSLENYTNAALPGLEFSAIGQDEYFRILKEVIGYFKSYMVEYAKDEFIYVFDGLFDYGGNSNMLNLFDEITAGTIRMIPKDSLTLHDASHAINRHKMGDAGLTSMYDEMQVHHRAAYKKIKQLGYDIIFDTGTHVTQFPLNVPDDEDKIEFSIYETDNGKQVRIYLK
jgi:hypothetical protein